MVPGGRPLSAAHTVTRLLEWRKQREGLPELF